ncbi:PfkB family carbohydrate kinase [Lacticaseibacillus thailandensis]|uniref:Ribokinase family sugar kinase n=1 Tax=Lacticaseibacillus thailandensis DSM 22698 = JCM 13996 TaxID=1423810 RepID=A0A0R2C929_9LACO|nr:PfkB family carbohydrate kinase [Lacticaseibacillus thailandensis]KRM87845.1 ribokinase family sugar kinase [Lacticaseibacillus thailandensis DSM 22698 = JCM 13996]
MTSTLIFGTALVDALMDIPRVPVSGGNVLGNFTEYQVGGCAINAFCALRYAGAQADLFVPVGHGPNADHISAHIRQIGEAPRVIPGTGDNGWTVAMIEPNGERTFIVLPGMEQLMRVDWLKQLDMPRYDYLYLSGFQLTNPQVAQDVAAVYSQRRSDATVLFDVAARIQSVDHDLLMNLLRSGGVIVHCNEVELPQVAVGDTFDEQVAYLHALTQQPVIVTLGARGTYYYVSDTDKGVVPGEHVNVVNTVGAGDSHCGGMLAGLAQGLSVRDAVSLGNRLAAKVCGMQTNMLPVVG